MVGMNKNSMFLAELVILKKGEVKFVRFVIKEKKQTKYCQQISTRLVYQTNETLHSVDCHC